MAVKSCVLCTYKRAAYRLFPSENSEALPNTMPSSVDSKIGKMFLKSLFYGVQIGSAQKMENLFF
jgi:hypothetical protein